MRNYKCFGCKAEIKFSQRKQYNLDGTPHKCGKQNIEDPDTAQATLFAMGAMNAIINGMIQKGGVDFIHHMNFHDVADASWQAAAAMIAAEKNYRYEIINALEQR